MTKTIFAGLFVALLAAGCSTTSTGGNLYRGPGFELTLPATTHFCTNKPPAPDHGFVALLQSADCLRSDTLPRLELMVSDMPRQPAEQPKDLTGKICFTGKAKAA
ncbi:MAG TPA: hypothetical protein VN229_25010, partial [Terriglobales bacterium]|nr:hypothetical protein [Terriglobales bacterium]